MTRPAAPRPVGARGADPDAHRLGGALGRGQRPGGGRRRGHVAGRPDRRGVRRRARAGPLGPPLRPGCRGPHRRGGARRRRGRAAHRRPRAHGRPAGARARRAGRHRAGHRRARRAPGRQRPRGVRGLRRDARSQGRPVAELAREVLDSLAPDVAAPRGRPRRRWPRRTAGPEPPRTAHPRRAGRPARRAARRGAPGTGRHRAARGRRRARARLPGHLAAAVAERLPALGRAAVVVPAEGSTARPRCGWSTAAPIPTPGTPTGWTQAR